MRSSLLGLAFILGCAAPPLPSSNPVVIESTVEGYKLSFEMPKSTWRVDEVIRGQATLSLEGEGSTTLSGSGSTVFSFAFASAGLRMDPVQTADCARYVIGADMPIMSEIRKSGAFDPNDPNYPFYDRWFHDPELHLPPGEWRIFATAVFYEGSECAGRRRLLTTSAAITVVE